MLRHVPLALQHIYGCSEERSEGGDMEDGNNASGGEKRVEITWSLVCIDVLLLCSELEEDLKMMRGWHA